MIFFLSFAYQTLVMALAWWQNCQKKAAEIKTHQFLKRITEFGACGSNQLRTSILFLCYKKGPLSLTVVVTSTFLCPERFAHSSLFICKQQTNSKLTLELRGIFFICLKFESFLLGSEYLTDFKHNKCFSTFFLGEYLIDFLALCHRKETLDQLIGGFGSEMRESGKTLCRLQKADT